MEFIIEGKGYYTIVRTVYQLFIIMSLAVKSKKEDRLGGGGVGWGDDNISRVYDQYSVSVLLLPGSMGFRTSGPDL